MDETGTWKMLVAAEDVTDEILASVDDCVDWFLDSPMGTEDFIDRLCKSYGGNGESLDSWDIESLDTPAVRKIMKRAREVRREALS